KALGYRRLVTYTQHGESGASLKAAGWRVGGAPAPPPGRGRPSRPPPHPRADPPAPLPPPQPPPYPHHPPAPPLAPGPAPRPPPRPSDPLVGHRKPMPAQEGTVVSTTRRPLRSPRRRTPNRQPSGATPATGMPTLLPAGAAVDVVVFVAPAQSATVHG